MTKKELFEIYKYLKMSVEYIKKLKLNNWNKDYQKLGQLMLKK